MACPGQRLSGRLEALGERFGPSYRWLVTITAIIGTVASILSSTIVNVALPDIMGAFGIGQDHAQLLSTGFLAAVTGTMLMNAWLVESFGFRATYAAAVGLFLFGSVVAGFAPNEGMLILGRILQGASAGMLQPLMTQIVFQVFPPEKRGSAMGIAAIGVVLAPALGPTVGGLLVDNYGWRSVFFLAMPVALLGLAMGWVFMPSATAPQRRRFDLPGFLLLILALLALFMGLSSGQRDGWGSNRVMFELGLAAARRDRLRAAGSCATAAPLLNPARLRQYRLRRRLLRGADLWRQHLRQHLPDPVVRADHPGLHRDPGRAGADAGGADHGGRLPHRRAAGGPAAGLAADGRGAAAVRRLLPGCCAASDTDIAVLDPGAVDHGRPGRARPDHAEHECRGAAGAAAALPRPGRGRRSISPWQFGGALGVNLLSILLEQKTELHAQSLTPTQDGGGAATLEFLRLTQGLLRQDGVPETELLGGSYDYLARVLAAQAGMLGFRDSFLAVTIACLIAVLPAMALRRRRVSAA